MVLLSVLIPTIDLRVKDKRFFKNLILKLSDQIIENNYQKKVEIIIYYDERQLEIGNKRNFLLGQAEGKFLCFIDDDDDVPEYYIKNIISVIEAHENIQYIGWRQQYILNGVADPKYTSHSLRHYHHGEDHEKYYQCVSHLNPVISTIAKGIRFPARNRAEDRDWSFTVAACLQSEYYIDEPMYYYYFDTETTLSADRPNARNYNNDHLDEKEVLKEIQQDFIKIHVYNNK